MFNLVEEVEQELARHIKGSELDPWEARFEWVTKEKEAGNALFKGSEYQEAIDQYLRAYCGVVGYKKGEQAKAEDRESIEKDLKSPLLNNIAMCLIKIGKL